VPWANEEHARCKPTASGDPSVDLRMALSRCCPIAINPRLPPLHLSRAGRHHEKRFVKSPAHLQAMPCVWLAESRWALKLGTTAPKPTHLELDVEPTQRPILHSKLDSKASNIDLLWKPSRPHASWGPDPGLDIKSLADGFSGSHAMPCTVPVALRCRVVFSRERPHYPPRIWLSQETIIE
jgi:hypothetical protein